MNTPADGSLQSLVNAINGTKDAGVRAAAVQVSPGQYRLQLTATDTGATNAFSLTGAAGAAAGRPGVHPGHRRPGRHAARRRRRRAGFDITSASNTVEGVMPGVTVKVDRQGQRRHGRRRARTRRPSPTRVQALVDAANAALTAIGDVSSNGVVGTDGTRTGAGALAGDSLMRQLTSQLLSKVTAGRRRQVPVHRGIGVNKDGPITFDQTKFATALAPTRPGPRPTFSTATHGGTGFADVVAKFAKDNGSSTGTIASAITGRQSTIKDLTDRIAGWDVTLARAGRAPCRSSTRRSRWPSASSRASPPGWPARSAS